MTTETNMRCDRCKFWSDKDVEIGWEAETIGFRECKAVRERWVIQDSANDGVKHYPGDDDAGEAAWIKKRNDALRTSRAYVQDGSEYRAELVTGPDRHCVFYKPAESWKFSDWLRGPNSQPKNPIGFSLLGLLCRLRDRGGCDLAQSIAERISVTVSAMLSRSVDELLLLRSFVRFCGFGFRHVASLADLMARREVHHV